MKMKMKMKMKKKKNKNKDNFLLALFGMLLLIAPVTARAMHISESYLPVFWAVIWYAAFIPFLLFGLKRVNEVLKKDLNMKLLLALVAAFAFCLSALKIPSIVGSCSHPTGVGLGAILFGPLPMVVVGSVVLLLQALLLAHGGLTTLGANGFSMAVVGPFVTYGLYKLLTKINVNKKWAIFFGAFLGNLMTYVTTSVQLGVAFPDAGGIGISIVKYMSIFVLTQLPIAIGEGILTVLVYNLLCDYKEQLGEAGEVL